MQNVISSVKQIFSAKRVRIASYIVLGTVVLGAVFLSLACFRYTFVIHGESIGCVYALDKAEDILSESRIQASLILERNVQLQDVAVKRSIALAPAKDINTKYITDALVQSVDGIEPMYVISMKGIPVGAVSTHEQATDLISALVEPYITDGVKVVNTSDITIEKELVNAEKVLCDEEQILRKLDPENTLSCNCANVVTIEMKEYEEAIPFSTEYVDDDSMYTDEEILEAEGVDGCRHVVVCVECINGEETDNRIEIESTVLAQPVTKIIRRGTIVRPSTDSTGYYIWPTNGIITNYYSYYHEGLDIANDEGTYIVAADGGYVCYCGYLGNYGYAVKILHDNGDITLYAHLSDYCVCEGERVYQGQLIGFMGETGNSTGPHLHLEIRRNGYTLNPYYYLY